ncbi:MULTISPECIES: hypothetical protein [Aestuariibaculum]|uniref:Uncharacterized protein n=1 Tax=Aestuariibaculum marinum TaxID=2683592 RepID=A0A8J6U3D5_9FLAO|nr:MULTISPECIES: hypothetical protein [Aestuariibaculum]MBD0823032.1 hypothetical protein [Aestuariibaculum marinum]WMI65462.1 hypothetical protein RBH94_15530 [Aestuariibaculum sp. YM273]
MDNPFQYINKPLKEVPPELKSKVMNDIAVAKLLMEMASLFSFDIAKVIEHTVKQRKK